MSDLAPATHVAVHRPGRGYDHHGIVLSDGRIFEIQRTPNGIEVRDIELDEFAQGSAVRVVPHGRAGLAGVFAPFEAADSDVVLGRVETLRLAYEQGVLGRYDLLDRNCEHLVNWCVAGDLDSVQVRKIWFAGGSIVSLALLGYMSLVSRGAVRRPAPFILAIAPLLSLVRIVHTTSIHRRIWKLSVTLAELDRERRNND